MSGAGNHIAIVCHSKPKKKISGRLKEVTVVHTILEERVGRFCISENNCKLFVRYTQCKIKAQ